MMRQSSKSSRHLGRAGLGWKATVTSCYRWKVSTSARKNMSVNCFGKLAKGDNTATAFDCSMRGPPIIDWEPSLMSEILYCQQSPPCFWTLALSRWVSIVVVMWRCYWFNWMSVFASVCPGEITRTLHYFPIVPSWGPAPPRHHYWWKRTFAKLPTSAFVLVSLVCQFKIYLPLTVGGLTHSFSIMS